MNSKLSYEQVVAIANELKDSSGVMETLLNGDLKNLFRQIGDEGVWAGDAASRARAEFDTLAAKFPEFVAAIDECHKYLLNVVESYKNIDTAATGR